MKKVALIALALITSLAISGNSINQAGGSSKKVPGTYELLLDTPQGEVETVLTIEKVKKEYKISMAGEGSSESLEVSEVKVEGNEVSFVFHAQGYDILMELVIDKDDVSGTMMNDYSVTGKRIKKKKK